MRSTIALGVSLLFGLAYAAAAQERIVIQGIVDAEVWASDSGSRLLTRNNGHPAPIGRLQLWAAAEPLRSLQLLVLGELETGKGRPSRDAAEGTEVHLEQVVLRYAPSPRLTVQMGKILSPVGIFGQRRLSTTNPLIGSPDSYPVSYPWGVEAAGSASRFDYRAAVVSLPVTNTKYLPEPGAAPHVVLGGGVTPHAALRIGASYTWGAYLSDAITDSLASGAHWRDYGQRLMAFDARLSLGYFEFNGELALSSYDVPGQAEPVDGTAYFGEVKYTWNPRFFTAARLEWNDYALVRPRAGGAWTARTVSFYNVEAGMGYRLDRQTLAKVSYQKDRWTNATDGHAVTFQLSRHFDVTSWLHD